MCIPNQFRCRSDFVTNLFETRCNNNIILCFWKIQFNWCFKGKSFQIYVDGEIFHSYDLCLIKYLRHNFIFYGQIFFFCHLISKIDYLSKRISRTKEVRCHRMCSFDFWKRDFPHLHKSIQIPQSIFENVFLLICHNFPSHKQKLFCSVSHYMLSHISPFITSPLIIPIFEII